MPGHRRALRRHAHNDDASVSLQVEAFLQGRRDLADGHAQTAAALRRVGRRPGCRLDRSVQGRLVKLDLGAQLAVAALDRERNLFTRVFISKDVSQLRRRPQDLPVNRADQVRHPDPGRRRGPIRLDTLDAQAATDRGRHRQAEVPLPCPSAVCPAAPRPTGVVALVAGDQHAGDRSRDDENRRSQSD